MTGAKKQSGFLEKFEAELSQLSPQEREKTIRTIQDRRKIAECLSGKAPFNLLKKFIGRVDEVSDVIESSFSDYEKGRIAFAQGRFDLAKKHLLIASASEHSKADYLLGLIANQTGNTNEATILLEQSAAGGFAAAYFALGSMAKSKNDREKMKTYFEKFEKTADRNDSNTYVVLGHIAVLNSDFEKGITLFNKAIEMKNPGGYVGHASVCALLSDKRGAAYFLSKAAYMGDPTAIEELKKTKGRKTKKSKKPKNK